MSERQSSLFTIVAHPHAEELLFPHGELPSFELPLPRGRTDEAHINGELRDQHGIVTQVHRSLPPFGQHRAFVLSVVQSTCGRMPEHAPWVPFREALQTLEGRQGSDAEFHFTRQALESIARKRTTRPEAIIHTGLL